MSATYDVVTRWKPQLLTDFREKNAIKFISKQKQRRPSKHRRSPNLEYQKIANHVIPEELANINTKYKLV